MKAKYIKTSPLSHPENSESVKTWYEFYRLKLLKGEQVDKVTVAEEVKGKMKDKIIAKKPTLVERDTVRELIRAIKRAPEKTRELLEEPYTESRATKNIIKIDEIAPEPEVGEQESRLGKNIVKHLMRLSILLEELDITKMRSTDKQQTIEIATRMIHRLGEIIRILKGETQNLLNPQNDNKRLAD